MGLKRDIRMADAVGMAFEGDLAKKVGKKTK
jgi:hypothetical protein